MVDTALRFPHAPSVNFTPRFAACEQETYQRDLRLTTFSSKCPVRFFHRALRLIASLLLLRSKTSLLLFRFDDAVDFVEVFDDGYVKIGIEQGFYRFCLPLAHFQ